MSGLPVTTTSQAAADLANLNVQSLSSPGSTSPSYRRQSSRLKQPIEKGKGLRFINQATGAPAKATKKGIEDKDPALSTSSLQRAHDVLDEDGSSANKATPVAPADKPFHTPIQAGQAAGIANSTAGGNSEHCAMEEDELGTSQAEFNNPLEGCGDTANEDNGFEQEIGSIDDLLAALPNERMWPVNVLVPQTLVKGNADSIRSQVHDFVNKNIVQQSPGTIFTMDLKRPFFGPDSVSDERKAWRLNIAFSNMAAMEDFIRRQSVAVKLDHQVHHLIIANTEAGAFKRALLGDNAGGVLVIVRIFPSKLSLNAIKAVFERFKIKGFDRKWVREVSDAQYMSYKGFEGFKQTVMLRVKPHPDDPLALEVPGKFTFPGKQDTPMVMLSPGHQCSLCLNKGHKAEAHGYFFETLPGRYSQDGKWILAEGVSPGAFPSSPFGDYLVADGFIHIPEFSRAKEAWQCKVCKNRLDAFVSGTNFVGAKRHIDSPAHKGAKALAK